MPECEVFIQEHGIVEKYSQHLGNWSVLAQIGLLKRCLGYVSRI